MMFNNTLKTLVFIFFALLFALTTSAQQRGNGNLSGVVVDESGIPLPGAEIYTKINSGFVGATSDFDGKFIVTNIPVGNQSLIIKYLGYKEKSISITVIEKTTTDIGKIPLQPDVESLDDVIVNARSKGQVRSLNIQKNSDNIVNVISLEQASKFPDSNIGDALKRVSGISIQTDQGEARSVSVRGLGSESTTVLVNGDRISATSFNSRSVEVDLIPADVIQNIEVTKSASADLDGEATGGVVNLITRAAYSKDLKFSLRSNYSITPTWDKINYNTAIGISKKFLNERLGVAFNGSSDSRSFQSNNIEIDWDFADTGEIDNPNDDTRFLNELEVRRYWVRRDRKNLNLGLDYEFSKNSLIGLKTSLSFRDDFENRYRTRYTSIDFPQEFTPDGIAISEGLVRTDTRGGTSEGKPNNYRLDRKNVFNNKLYGEHVIGSVEADWSLSYSKAKKRRTRRSIDYRVIEGESTLFIDARNPNRPRVTSDIENFNESAVLGSISETFQNLDDDAFKGSVTLKIPFKNGYLKTGARYRRNGHSEDNRNFDIAPITGDINDFEDIEKENYHTNSSELNSYEGFDSPSREFVGSLDINNPLLFTTTEDFEYNFNNSYDVVEKRSAAYIQGKYEFSENFSVRGGVRWELTQGDYNAYVYNEVEDVITPNNVNIEYDNLLPSIDFKYKIKSNLIARLAYAKTLNRPTYTRLLPRVGFTGGDADDITDNTVLRLGNPDLKPRISDNFDFSLELYLRKAGLVSVGVFHKELNNFIGSVSSFETLVDGRVLDIRQFQNLGTGRITGVELVFQRGLDFLPWHFRNLNFYGNITLLDSELSNFTTSLSNTVSTNLRGNEKRNLADTADFTYNVSLSYKAKKVEVTASYNSTSEFIDSYGIIAIQDEYEDEKSFLDLNASYSINSNLNIFLEAKNLTNQALREYVGERQILQREEYYGAQYVLGFNYKF
ncbi:TonB-dependent receptor [Flavivirga aquimarina]|uniref:TonB-dependent receptor n=1 Tax=Flavivirga aquimarina TaxID=2027862 RepID=A0ABT8W584_9FLAO|nr:TonB-dependent receptor [Flavivirga aquimarina]MDO5968271.1 TonB-dependent receptor [Flavivirga aquimarina]